MSARLCACVVLDSSHRNNEDTTSNLGEALGVPACWVVLQIDQIDQSTSTQEIMNLANVDCWTIVT